MRPRWSRSSRRPAWRPGACRCRRPSVAPAAR
jgi:hypothetical protein